MSFAEIFFTIVICVISSGVFSLLFWLFCLKYVSNKVKDQVTLYMDTIHSEINELIVDNTVEAEK